MERAHLQQGDAALVPMPGADEAYCLVYDELRRLAHRLLAEERPDHTLQSTALVNEAYLRLRRHPLTQTASRAQLLALGARAMRQILIDHARQRLAAKRGGGRRRSPLIESGVFGIEEGVGMLDLLDTFEKLEGLRDRTARIVEMRCFGGLTDSEIGEVLGVSRATVSTEWRFARAWISRELGLGAAP